MVSTQLQNPALNVPLTVGQHVQVGFYEQLVHGRLCEAIEIGKNPYQIEDLRIMICRGYQLNIIFTKGYVVDASKSPEYPRWDILRTARSYPYSKPGTTSSITT
jgi:hypothetical protein